LGRRSLASGLLDGQRNGGPPAAPPPTTKNQLGRLDMTSLEDEAVVYELAAPRFLHSENLQPLFSLH
jgi:hypothetical protein